jgi:hypothetical protein
MLAVPQLGEKLAALLGYSAAAMLRSSPCSDEEAAEPAVAEDLSSFSSAADWSACLATVSLALASSDCGLP